VFCRMSYSNWLVNLSAMGVVLVTMMDIRHVRMCMDQSLMGMKMRVLSRGYPLMFVFVMTIIVSMGMFVNQHFMNMWMFMLLIY